MSEVELAPPYEYRTEQIPGQRVPEFNDRLIAVVDKVRAEQAGWMVVGVIMSMESDWAYVVFERLPA